MKKLKVVGLLLIMLLLMGGITAYAILTAEKRYEGSVTVVKESRSTTDSTLAFNCYLEGEPLESVDFGEMTPDARKIIDFVVVNEGDATITYLHAAIVSEVNESGGVELSLALKPGESEPFCVQLTIKDGVAAGTYPLTLIVTATG